MASISSIVDNKICCGCGACYVACPQCCIEFVYGNRFNYPKIDANKCTGCGKCLKVCPSAFLLDGTNPGFYDEPMKANYDCYLIHSTDNNIRLDASSGGFITGLILHLMNSGLADGGIVARTQGPNALVAESFIATNRQALLDARASKYAPVSNCIVLAEVIKRPGRYVFVGTPCMIEALTKLKKQIPELNDRIILTIGLVCAGMPSRQSTTNYLKRYGINPKDARKVCYRGGGWPGSFKVYGDTGLILERPLLNDELDYLVPCDHYLRCWNCMDHWGRFSDIVVSDPWCDEFVKTETKGRSAVMIRTESGHKAMALVLANGEMAADAITIEEMLGYNRHLLIGHHHSRHAWMGIYQLVFFGRIRNSAAIIRSLIQRKGIGLNTTLRVKLDKNYYS